MLTHNRTQTQTGTPKRKNREQPHAACLAVGANATLTHRSKGHHRRHATSTVGAVGGKGDWRSMLGRKGAAGGHQPREHGPEPPSPSAPAAEPQQALTEPPGDSGTAEQPATQPAETQPPPTPPPQQPAAPPSPARAAVPARLSVRRPSSSSSDGDGPVERNPVMRRLLKLKAKILTGKLGTKAYAKWVARAY